jgi:hypothetical protein
VPPASARKLAGNKTRCLMARNLQRRLCMSQVRSEANNSGAENPDKSGRITYSVVGREKTNEYECRVMESEV